jgi:hypothetical protein
VGQDRSGIVTWQVGDVHKEHLVVGMQPLLILMELQTATVAMVEVMVVVELPTAVLMDKVGVQLEGLPGMVLILVLAPIIAMALQQ